MSKTINTVLGPIEAKDLGKTLMHEHLLYGFCGFQGDETLGGFDELYCIKQNMKWLTPLKEKYGFKTIVDATTLTAPCALHTYARCTGMPARNTSRTGLMP